MTPTALRFRPRTTSPRAGSPSPTSSRPPIRASCSRSSRRSDAALWRHSDDEPFEVGCLLWRNRNNLAWRCWWCTVLWTVAFCGDVIDDVHWLPPFFPTCFSFSVVRVRSGWAFFLSALAGILPVLFAILVTWQSAIVRLLGMSHFLRSYMFRGSPIDPQGRWWERVHCLCLYIIVCSSVKRYNTPFVNKLGRPPTWFDRWIETRCRRGFVPAKDLALSCQSSYSDFLDKYNILPLPSRVS